ncbi:hypothetical protein jhhlp_007508 [Lomentospora prolificans]|uniref:Uncharacterized protein n=1 Tax=Lomentospora prolificans TaxID=41688 RepID=A0A2N3N1A1_9PEZI|nr:hypothetical protein jhhlp_007508 [Lomentospora prolificans]
MTTSSRLSAYDPEYSGTVMEKVTSIVTGNKLERISDKVKGAKAIYEVIIGEGIGKGLEREVRFPLGKDAVVRVGEVRDKLIHAAGIFGSISEQVAIENIEK